MKQEGYFIVFILVILLVDMCLSVIIPTLSTSPDVGGPVLGVHGIVVLLLFICEFGLMAQTTTFQAGLFMNVMEILKWPLLFLLAHLIMLALPWSYRAAVLSPAEAIDVWTVPAYVAIYLIHIATALLHGSGVLYVLQAVTDPHLYVPIRPRLSTHF